MNVVGSRPDGWWADRDGAVARLIDEVRRWRRRRGEPVLVVVDGHPSPPTAEGSHDGVHVLYARSSLPDAADDRIVAVVGRHPDPGSLVVVTSDATLAERARGLGARVEGAGAFRRRLEGG